MKGRAWDLALLQGQPEQIVLGNGPEDTSRSTFDRPEQTGVRPCFIEPGNPFSNACVGRVPWRGVAGG
ncbi:MAG: hypothetical protein ABFD84_10405, partial [Candidatus Polarisedimenticolia bacterium]